MLTEEILIESIDVNEDNSLAIKYAQTIYKDGAFLTKIYIREVLHPGSDTSNHHEKIKGISGLLWTEEVILKWKAKEKADKDKTP